MHGSNRLGGNSLSDLLVFGRRAGLGASDYVRALPERPAVSPRKRWTTPPNSRCCRSRTATNGDSPENPYTLQLDLQDTMNSLVGIIRKDEEVTEALDKLTELRERYKRVRVDGGRPFNPGWHLAIDLRNMMLVSECVAKAALERTESRGGHTRDDHPSMESDWRKTLLVCRTDGDPEALVPDVSVTQRGPDPGAPGSARPVRALRIGEVLHRRRTRPAPRTEQLMAYEANMRVWRGDLAGGALQDYEVEVNEGEVVLDIIHRLQQTQTADLAVRWNCKAGKCGSCSAEVNGRPRLMCMTRMSTFGEDETITVTPLRTFPVIRDLVTDVSFNYEKAREIPSFTPPKDLQPGEYRMAQEDVNRSQEFRKCIECFLCQNTCHVVRDHEENKEAFSGPRYLMRQAELDMHPLDTLERRPEQAQEENGLGYCNITKCCTEVCPEHIKITDNALIPMKERAADRKYDPVVWLGNKLFRRS